MCLISVNSVCVWIWRWLTLQSYVWNVCWSGLCNSWLLSDQLIHTLICCSFVCLFFQSDMKRHLIWKKPNHLILPLPPLSLRLWTQTGLITASFHRVNHPIWNPLFSSLLPKRLFCSSQHLWYTSCVFANTHIHTALCSTHTVWSQDQVTGEQMFLVWTITTRSEQLA